MFALEDIQTAVREFGFDGWLLYDFRAGNLLARRVLDVPDGAVTTRRFFYFIPAEGEPQKLVHHIEAGVLDHLPGSKTVYLRWQELEAGVARLVQGRSSVAMEYSSRNANPYVSRVDAGTVELVRGCGVDVGSSGDLIQRFEATWSDEQWEQHRRAAVHTDAAFSLVWKTIAEQIEKSGGVDETGVQSVILEHFAEHSLTTDHPPIVAVGPNSGNPHYETGTGSNSSIQPGDFVLVDLWARTDHRSGVYSDLTRVAYVGEEIPQRYEEVFRIVAAARDAAINCVRQAFAGSSPLKGWQVDQAARDVIEQAGYGEFFVHRTGHSIGRETHGNGANMDNLETHEDRRVMRRTCFSIEPGIYLPEFGIRSEVNVFIDAAGTVHVTGGEPQQSIQRIVLSS